MSGEAIGIESRWGPSDFDEVSEDTPQLVGILDDGDYLHVRTALWAGRSLRDLLAHASWAGHRPHPYQQNSTPRGRCCPVSIDSFSPASLHVVRIACAIDEMVERVFSEIEIPPMDLEWKPALRTRCQSARRVLNRHSWAAPLMESRSSPGPANMRHHDAVIGFLRRGGFSIALAAHAYAVLDSYVYGFAFEEANLPEANRDEFAPAVETIARQIDVKSYPYLVEMAREHVLRPGYEFGSSFDFGLDLILDGLEHALLDGEHR